MTYNLKKPVLRSPKTAEELLDMYFLDARSQMLETAAILDRIERAEGGAKAMDDNRLKKLRDVCDILKNGRSNRAEQFLMLFSENLTKRGLHTPSASRPPSLKR
ncbi:MAG: hypothetical protein JRE64_20000 [Deltaproteobacteria bacterium]|nr:hypothetical protein [Deltaproteobacteria bacterium]